MTSEGVAPGHQKLQVAALIGGPTEDWSGEGLERLGHRLGRTINLPALLTGREIKGDEIGRDVGCSGRSARYLAVFERNITLQNLHDEIVARKNGAGGKGPLKREVFATLRDEIFAPLFLSFHVKDDQFPVAEKEGDPLAVRDRRRRGEVAAVIQMHPSL